MNAKEPPAYGCPADVLGHARALSAAEQAALLRLRAVLRDEVHPLLAEHWERGEFPGAIASPLIGLDLMRPAEVLARGEEPGALYAGFRNFELARTDASVATWYNAQAGLFRTVVALGGSPAQSAALDPLITRFERTGVFALTEPEHGSDIAQGLQTRARWDAKTGEWIIDGAKRWIGGALSADLLAVFARDVADGRIKCFLVPRETPGVGIAKIHGKASLRIMQNADIVLEVVRVPEAARLARIEGWHDVSRCLRAMRADVAWIAVGAAAGAYEAALAHVMARRQFGRPIGAFQLIQEKLARMLGNITAGLGITVQLSRLQQEGVFRDEHSALGKMTTARLLRETVALAREVCGGDGIVLDRDVARFHADAEAIYSYEGTDEINALVVGRAVTGLSAFA